MKNSPDDHDSRCAKLRKLESHLRHRIRGQDHAIPRIASLLQRGELGLRKPGRPRGSFLFLGPTGVGKTEVTLAFTEFLLGADCLFRFDMSEYQNQESLALLLGGKLGERGILALAYDKHRCGTLLFDEIEKAHPRVLDVFLQILDAARVTMASGETLDLSGFYVVFTSNIASADVVGLQHSSFATMERHVLTRAQQSMRPELYARISEKLVFNKLTYDVQLEIARLLLAQELEFLRGSGHELMADPSVLPFLVRRGFHPRLGARPMRDAVEKSIGDAVASELLTGGSGCGKLTVDESGERLLMTR
jgi:ATP-dependent Clp protease ATP-binding subunit ClpA